MEIGVIFIIGMMLAIAPIAIILSKTPFFKAIEDKFFEEHDHYM